MKFLIIDSDYPKFLTWLYETHPGLGSALYAEQIRARGDSLFSYADFFSSNLRRLGHEAAEIFDNNEIMQRTWAREAGIELASPSPVATWATALARRMRRVSPARPKWVYDILGAQIRHHRPDVLLNRNLVTTDSGFIREMKPFVRMIVGQHAAFPLHERLDLRGYDLVLSSFPPMVEWFRKKGLRSELHRLGFEPRILDLIENVPRTEALTFVGNFYNIHGGRLTLIEGLCERFPQMKVWSPSLDNLSPNSPIHRHWQGEAWGVGMYRVLAGSRITLNHHGDIAPYANNLRLYEATGMGAMLLTDQKRDLGELFEPGREVMAYESAEDCAAKIEDLLRHEDRRAAIAEAGQHRTLNSHTYLHRMEQLVQIVQKYL